MFQAPLCISFSLLQICVLFFLQGHNSQVSGLSDEATLIYLLLYDLWTNQISNQNLALWSTACDVYD